jgi:hypothetical protein
LNRERLVVAGLALLAVYPFFASYLPPFSRVHLWSDASGFQYPLQWFGFQALKEGRIPMWDPSIYCGISYIGNVQATFLYPPQWLLFAAMWRLPRLPFKAVEAYIFLHVWLAFVLCYCWLRGRALPLASALGAMTFACGGYMLYQLLHPGVVYAMTWMPLGFWGIDEAVERRDWKPLWKVAAASALAFLAGYPACWIVHCFAMGFYALASRAPVRAVVGTVAALAASLPLIAMQLLPALDGRSMMQLEIKYGSGAYGPGALLASYFTPNFHDFNLGHPTSYDAGCMYFYLGIPALFAVVWGLWRHRTGPYVQALVLAAAMLALANPRDWMIHAVECVSFLKYTMQPFNFYAGVAAAAALFTAVALEDYLAGSRSTLAETSLGTAGMSACATLPLLYWVGREIVLYARGAAMPVRWHSAKDAAIAAAIFGLGLWAVRETKGRARVALAAVLLLAVTVDYKVYGTPRWFNAVDGDVDNERPAYGIHGVDDQEYRAMWTNRQYRIATGHDVGPAPTDFRVWELATPQGFDPFLPVRYRETIERWTKFDTNRMFTTDLRNDAMMRGLGVRYVLVPNFYAEVPWLKTNPKFRRVAPADSYMHVYEYLDAKAPYGWEDEGAGSVEPASWIAERREFRVQSERGGRFFLVEQFFPGWRATVDGAPTRIDRWGGAFQSILVEGGAHRVRFEFRPRSFYIGLAMSFVGWAMVVLVAARKR